jgi:hypothetical protein
MKKRDSDKYAKQINLAIFIICIFVLLFVIYFYFNAQNQEKYSEKKESGFLDSLKNLNLIKIILNFFGITSLPEVPSYYGITCSNDDECPADAPIVGTEECPSEICSSVVLGKWMDWYCKDPGTPESTCIGVPGQNLVPIKECPEGQGCNNGGCINIECQNHESCPNSTELICKGNSVYEKKLLGNCDFCVCETIPGDEIFVKECGECEKCENGNCNPDFSKDGTVCTKQPGYCWEGKCVECLSKEHC